LQKALRIGVRTLGVLAAVVLAVSLMVYARSEAMIRHQYELPGHAPFVLSAGSDSALIERGRHLAGPIGKCVDCHGSDLSGRVFIDDPAFGRYVGPNLTRGVGGVGATLTDADWELAIRHGIDGNRHALLFMPSSSFNRLSDEDLAALIAYVKQVPPTNNAMVRSSRIGPVGRALLVAGKAPLIIEAAGIDHQSPHAPAPAIGPTAAYGAYVASVGGCQGCHRSNLEGGHVAGTPPSFKAAANLTPTGIGTWTKADFVRALREGMAPGGVAIDSFMPVRLTKGMSDTEIDAVWAYVQTVPPRPIGK
jgi:mono/diheme cytochrome c family protein